MTSLLASYAPNHPIIGHDGKTSVKLYKKSPQPYKVEGSNRLNIHVHYKLRAYFVLLVLFKRDQHFPWFATLVRTNHTPGFHGVNQTCGTGVSYSHSTL